VRRTTAPLSPIRHIFVCVAFEAQGVNWEIEDQVTMFIKEHNGPLTSVIRHLHSNRRKCMTHNYPFRVSTADLKNRHMYEFTLVQITLFDMTNFENVFDLFC
jgi:hypothetical protein